jgi:hypothetical protein
MDGLIINFIFFAIRKYQASSKGSFRTKEAMFQDK